MSNNACFEYLAFILNIIPGVSANADPHTKKLRARVARIWGDRRVQPIRCAMEWPRPGGTPLMIRVPSAPGKYDLDAEKEEFQAMKL